jgi:hypothetical protein
VPEGVDVKTAQARLGHTDPRLTLAVYAQATAEADLDVADRLGERFLRREHGNAGHGIADARDGIDPTSQRAPRRAALSPGNSVPAVACVAPSASTLRVLAPPPQAGEARWSGRPDLSWRPRRPETSRGGSQRTVMDQNRRSER